MNSNAIVLTLGTVWIVIGIAEWFYTPKDKDRVSKLASNRTLGLGSLSLIADKSYISFFGLMLLSAAVSVDRMFLADRRRISTGNSEVEPARDSV